MGLRTIWTSKRETALIEAIREGKTFSSACRISGISRSAFYARRKEDPAFAALVEDAYEEGTDIIEDDVLSLGRTGNVVALLATLKARRPEKWRENQKIEHTGPDGTALTIVFRERQDGPQ